MDTEGRKKAGLFDTRTEKTRDDWLTPAWVLDLVRSVAPIGLDPCAGKKSLVQAEVEYHYPEQDGLKLEWNPGPGKLTFANPPYGSALAGWAKKYAHEAMDPRKEIIMLTPARTEARWFHVAGESSEAVAFLKRRVHFLDPETGKPPLRVNRQGKTVKMGSTFPSALFYTGPRRRIFYRAFRAAAWVVPTDWGGGA